MALCKVEYLAHKERIQQRLRAGYPVSYIHQELRDEGAITMSSRSFYRLINADKAARWADIAAPQPTSTEKSTKPPWRKEPDVSPEDDTSIQKFAYNPGENDDHLW